MLDAGLADSGAIELVAATGVADLRIWAISFSFLVLFGISISLVEPERSIEKLALSRQLRCCSIMYTNGVQWQCSFVFIVLYIRMAWSSELFSITDDTAL